MSEVPPEQQADCVPLLVADNVLGEECGSKLLAELYRNKADSIVRIRDGSLASGTGFFVTHHGQIATDYHVIRNSKEIFVDTTDGRSFRAKISLIDPPNDLAIIKIVAPPRERFPALTLTHDTTLGSSVAVLGHPTGFYQVIASVGTVDAKLRLKNVDLAVPSPPWEDLTRQFLGLKMQTSRGNSGSPLFNTKGQVIGILDTVGAVGNPDSGATPASYILNLLNRQSQAYRIFLQNGTREYSSANHPKRSSLSAI